MDAYIYQAALICSDCAAQVKNTIVPPYGYNEYDESSWDSDDYPKGPYSDGGGEADCPQHCDHCRTFLENPLTDVGEVYVRAAVSVGDGDKEVLAEWKAFYDYLTYKKSDEDDE